MKTEELMREVLRGRLLIVGEYRGSHAERKGYVDRKSGNKIEYIRAIHLIECACRGSLDRAVVYQRLPEIVETPEEAVFPYLKSRLWWMVSASMSSCSCMACRTFQISSNSVRARASSMVSPCACSTKSGTRT